jgi:allantoin racemase
MALSQTSMRGRDPRQHEVVQALLQSYASPGTEIDLCYPDDHPGERVAEVMAAQNARSELHYLVSTTALVRKAVWAQEAGYNAVVQTTAFDPGVEASRLAVRIPVIGLCRTSMLIAAGLGERIGITVPYDGYALHVRRLLRSYRMEQHVVAVRSLALKGAGRTSEVVGARGDLLAQAKGLMKALIDETGADCIVPLGAAVIPYVVSPSDLQQQLGVPVLNPTQLGIRFAELCVQLGLTHSAGAYQSAQFAATDFDLPL